MTRLLRKNIAVIGASRGIGREIALMCAEEGGNVLAVARSGERLAQFKTQNPAVATLAADATAADAPQELFTRMQPDVLILSAGALPPVRPLPELAWSEFATNWDMDVRMTFEFCKQALRQPLAPGAVVIVISSGAAIGGSPISGGYAGAKRTQMFITQYAQRESDRLALGLRFVALVPMGIMPETDIGRHAVRGYSNYLGVSSEDFIGSLSGRPAVADVVKAAVSMAAAPFSRTETALLVSAAGLTAARTA